MRHKLVKQQTVKELDTRRSCQGSPYWDFINNNARFNDDGEAAEPIQANPDVLAEDKAMYAVTPDQTRTQERVQELLRRAPQMLTEVQYKVFSLILRGKKIREIARLLGRDESSIRQSWKLSQKKLEREYAKGN